MTATLFARTLDSTRLAALAAALAIATTSAEAQEAASDPFAPAPISLGAATSTPDSFSEDLYALRQLADEAAAFADRPARTFGVADDCFPGRTAAEDAARRASVYLISIYEGGVTNQGSGTIVAGAGGRVLTAAHVAPPVNEFEGRAVELLEIQAFDSTGAWIATLQPVLVGSLGVAEGAITDPTAIAGDLAVLEVTALADGLTMDRWEARGIEIAPVQSPWIQVVTGAPGHVAFNPGMSGAAVLDDRQRIIGVASVARWQDEVAGRETASGFLARGFEKAQAGGGPEWGTTWFGVHQTGAILGKGAPIHPGGIVIAPPVLDADVLEALGQDRGAIDIGVSVRTGTIAGYPNHQCRLTRTSTTPMAGLTAEPVQPEAGHPAFPSGAGNLPRLGS
ncbi:hypothetical protein LAZ40_09565 [Cereibacter sphaeroides]|uniref:hypothetical protein n=1 Tax=Cereibacter sphaeroides TaxID=1063 RepID=UPI001F3E5A6B|nr:hypothetical protein [Cereibacter sphaeroides]MCE6959299.1 hypothetical protein [Cereibacter sphaeroides]MCE6972891.1 hypothetical protein [Cereibacter sphaeroides]